MRIWQDIFEAKLAEIHLTEPWTLQEDDTLQAQACRPDWKEFVQRRAPGRCQGWGMIWMRIFHQECRRCSKPRLEDPEFSLETIESVLHNLVVKILQYFYNEPVQPSDLLEVMVDTPVAGPHDSAHCEACQLGICNKSRLAPALDAWKPLIDADKDRTHHTKSRPALTPDAWKPLKDVGKARTHHNESRPASKWVAYKPLRDADKSRIFQTLKRQDLGPHAASTQPLSPCNSNFPWKRCCCISSSLLCVLAVIIFVVLYFTMM